MTIGISTLGEGIRQIALPPQHSALTYLIVVQRPPQGAETFFADRSDVTVRPIDSVGVSNNRNAVLELATGDLLVPGDDDVTWNVEGLLRLRERFTEDPSLDLGLAWRRERRPDKPLQVAALTRFNSGRAAAPEMILRLSSVRQNGLRFDTAFGLGAKWGIGEEYVFIADALKAGLKGISAPEVTCGHPHESTGNNWPDETLLAGRQAVLSRVFGAWSILARPAFALKHRAKFPSRRRALWFALGR